MPDDRAKSPIRQLTRREWIIASVLAASLALNCLVLGFWGGRTLSQTHAAGQAAGAISTSAADQSRADRRQGDARRDQQRIWRSGLSIPAFLRAIPQEHRRDVRQDIRALGQNAAAELDELSKARQAVRDALSAEEFSPDTVSAALARLNAAEAAIRGRGHEVMIGVLTSLPDDARRQTLAALLAAPPQPGPAGRANPRPTDGPNRGPNREPETEREGQPNPRP